MPFIPAAIRAQADSRPVELAIASIALVSVVRLLLLPFYGTDLGPDEAQYWYWGQDLAWGYYSKPPMIAWLIAATTGLFGDHVWAVRLFSPLLIGGSAVFLFLAARRLFGDRIGFWAAALWLTLPVVMFGATIMTTDIPLLFCYTGALWCVVRLADSIEGEGLGWGVGAGAFIGVGFLAKYAMMYFVLGWVLAIVFSSFGRRSLRAGPVLAALAVAALIFGPNIWWNAANGFQTVGHTADNAGWEGLTLHFGELFQFVGDQFGVIGPILFGILLFGIGAWIARDRRPTRETFLLCFILPPLLIICLQALLSRAHANWSLAAYPAAMILIPAWVLHWRREWLLALSAGLHAAIGLFFTIVLLDLQLADDVGMSNAVKRLRGWPEQAEQIRVAAAGRDAVIVDEREIAAHLVWEWRDAPIPLQVFDLNGRTDNTYESSFPFEPEGEGRYLLATQNARYLCAYDRFGVVAPSGTSFVDLNAERRGVPERTIELYGLSAYDPDRPVDCP
jgi:hypothetical protein